MRKSLFSNQIPHFVCLVALAASGISFSEQASREPLERLRAITTKIDSLEVEKQTLKRAGHAIDELERTTAMLRDSVILLREELRSDVAVASEVSRTIASPLTLKKYLPSTFSLIDKILIGAGAITVLSLLFFLLFFVSALIRKRRRAPSPRSSPQKVEPPSPRRTDSTALHAYGAQMKEQVGAKPQPTVQPPPVAPPAAPPSSHTGKKVPDSLSDQVLKAWSAGQDAKTISQRLHIGVDQVALIVKMAKKK